MSTVLSKEQIQHSIAARVAQEIQASSVVNLGIGIPTLVSQYALDPSISFHTENGLLGVTDVHEGYIDPNLVNAGKLPVGQGLGASFFDSAESFAMIRGSHIDIAILGALQVDETGIIANWSVPGKNIIGVGGAMDLLVGARKVIVTMSHTSKDGSSKLLKKCTYPITSTRQVDMIVTELAVFKVIDGRLNLIELMNGAALQEVERQTEADFIVQL
ncbi:3-oxoacid CoA-transferase subunit B [Ureibacillus sp. GCM10028918]|uniref:3-oxoacid CoA-transferase subunit B n=1 Tax=Ureibacillus sp. GCM10028918 TaxID=3273429 RepID=UPI0036142A72